MKTHSKTLGVLVAGLLASSLAGAATMDFGAYFRSGAGSSSEGGKEVCFRLPSATVWFRLGNECDSYVDLKFGATLGQVDGTTFRTKFTISNGTQGLANWEQSSPSLREAFVEAQDLGAAMAMPALNGAALWAGKRFYKNPDIHMLDYTYWEPAQGPGFGLDNVDVGVAKFSYALLRIGDFSGYGINPSLGGFNPDLIGGGSRTATVHDLRLQDIVVNPGGKVTLGVDVVRASNRDGSSIVSRSTTVGQLRAAGEPLLASDGRTVVDTTGLIDSLEVRQYSTIDNKPGRNGIGLTVTHEQADLFGLGGSHLVGLQVARDAVSLKGFGFAGSTDDRREWLLFNQWYVAPKGSRFSATSTFGWRDSQVNGSGLTEAWIGTRPVYNLNNIWSLISEIGYQQVRAEGEATRKLAKLTLGTQFSMGPGVWARPSIRFFTTYARWNDAAAAAGPVTCTGRDCATAVDAYADKRSGLSYGVQVEAWF